MRKLGSIFLSNSESIFEYYIGMKYVLLAKFEILLNSTLFYMRFHYLLSNSYILFSFPHIINKQRAMKGYLHIHFGDYIL